MFRTIHLLAGAISLASITTFWFSTLLFEIFGAESTIITVKTAIPWGFLVLIPALATAGGSGLALAGGRKAGVVNTKIRRMRLVAGNGFLILVPAALFLAHKAANAEFDGIFHIVQALELVAGAMNIVLLSLNMRDGMRMRRSRHSKLAVTP